MADTATTPDPAQALTISHSPIVEPVETQEDPGYRGDKVDPLPNSHYTFPGPPAEKEVTDDQ